MGMTRSNNEHASPREDHGVWRWRVRGRVVATGSERTPSAFVVSPPVYAYERERS